MYSLIRSEMYNDAIYITYNRPDITRVYPVYGIWHYTCIVFATVCVCVCVYVCVNKHEIYCPLEYSNLTFMFIYVLLYWNIPKQRIWGGGGTHKPLGLPCGRDDCFHSSCCLVGWTLIKVIIKTTVGVYWLNQEIKKKNISPVL